MTMPVNEELRVAMLESVVDLAEKAREAGGHIAAEAYAKACRDVAEAYGAVLGATRTASS
jgi:hypothetical protein